ncbi:MAG: DUF2065 domain-containing protein [Magnetococcales bacterium]|nr:DUF2065 domain-containing protein [Magnetococcales bacterium]
MNDFLTALGLVMILEGIPYFALPDRMRRLVIHIAELPDSFLRRTGFLMMCLGLLVIYLVRS